VRKKLGTPNEQDCGGPWFGLVFKGRKKWLAEGGQQVKMKQWGEECINNRGTTKPLPILEARPNGSKNNKSVVSTETSDAGKKTDFTKRTKGSFLLGGGQTENWQRKGKRAGKI